MNPPGAAMRADPDAIRAHMDEAAELWPDPKALPSTLPAVAPFDAALLPPVLRAWVMDIAERMQAPADFIAVTAMVAAGSVIGRKVAIRPQKDTNWTEAPNVWGCIVGRSGVMKSPAMKAALAPVRRLDAEAAEKNQAALAEHAASLDLFKLEQAAKLAEAKRLLKKGNEGNLDGLVGRLPPDAPAMRRYAVNDTTYEKLGEIVSQNPNGVLAFRDELVSLLRPLDREENASARGFYLSAWNGTDGYTFDRIMRGTVHIKACCISLLGSTQPGRLAAYLRSAVRGGAGDDGFAQRFGMLVWPDVSPDWKDVDRFPDGDGRRAVNLLFDRLDGLDPDAVGAERDPFDPELPFLRFDGEALVEFRVWRESLERRVRSGSLHPAMESHLAKYRGLAPKLALILHLLDEGEGPIGTEALMRALSWIEYLETHAFRAYASVTSAEAAGARTIIVKLRAGELASPFTAREIYQADWTGLANKDEVAASLDLLVDYDWLAEETQPIGPTGGRPKRLYTANPRGLR